MGKSNWVPKPFRALLLKYYQLRIDFWGAVEDFVCDRYSAALNAETFLRLRAESVLDSPVTRAVIINRLDTELERVDRYTRFSNQMELWPGDTDEDDWAAFSAEGEEDGTQN